MHWVIVSVYNIQGNVLRFNCNNNVYTYTFLLIQPFLASVCFTAFYLVLLLLCSSFLLLQRVYEQV